MGSGVQCYYFFQKIFNLVLPTGLIQIISVAGPKYRSHVKVSLTMSRVNEKRVKERLQIEHFLKNGAIAL